MITIYASHMIEQQAFWQTHQRFLKTTLSTEQPNPITTQLSELAKTDLRAALHILRKVDLAALSQLPTANIERARKALQQHLDCNRRIFILGCGASGRMAVWLGYQWRQYHPNKQDQIVDLIAGGDYALIRSIESFEDQTKLASQQLSEYAFGKDDVLIACSASGESPFLLAAVEHALSVSNHSPWLLYCNPDEELLARNPNHLLAHSDITAHCLNIGPMALTGSTRMQATTVMQVFLSLALFGGTLEDVIAGYPSEPACQKLASLITAESDALQAGQTPITYECNDELALCVLSDTTERTPTFNLPPFDNQHIDEEATGWFQLHLPQTHWKSWLGRLPYCLAWPTFPQTYPEILTGFRLDHPDSHPRLKIEIHNQQIHLMGFGQPRITIPLAPKTPGWLQQTWLRALLNMHSTLVMGRLGCFQGNLMTHLIPSNHKLIDRAIRYTQYRYQTLVGRTLSYDDAAELIFQLIPTLSSNESIVESTLIELQKNHSPHESI